MYHQGFAPQIGKRAREGEGQRMGTQGTHENSTEEMVKWTLGHSKCERTVTGGYYLGSAVSQFGPCSKGKYFYHFIQSQF